MNSKPSAEVDQLKKWKKKKKEEKEMEALKKEVANLKVKKAEVVEATKTLF